MLRVDWDYYQRFMNVNMNGALLCTRACFRSMRKRGGGAIVNQSSTASWMGVGYYGLAKAGMNALTHALARELGSQKIRVNAIAPGPTDTDALAKQVPEAYRQQMVAQLPLARLGTHAGHGERVSLPVVGRRVLGDRPDLRRRRRTDRAGVGEPWRCPSSHPRRGT